MVHRGQELNVHDVLPQAEVRSVVPPARAPRFLRRCAKLWSSCGVVRDGMPLLLGARVRIGSQRPASAYQFRRCAFSAFPASSWHSTSAHLLRS